MGSENNQSGLKNSQDKKLENRLLEAFDSLWSDFIDPRDAYEDNTGQYWSAISSGNTTGGVAQTRMTPQDLAELRSQCRYLALTNEYAINGHENRISYIVGNGHRYRISIKKGIEAPSEIALQTQGLVDDFLSTNRWQHRQQEIVRRMDRDGEAFLRFFVDEEGMTHVRFVEPEEVFTPRHLEGNLAASFGIQTKPNDVETVEAYFVGSEVADAREIQHRKSNVDANSKRGLPIFTPVRKNLRRAEKLLRNMSVVAEIQSAIALIRRHRSTSRTGVEQFVSREGEGNGKDGAKRFTYGPGTILDAPAGTEYDFPVTGIDASTFIRILQAELRAVASRLVMPEFMFTSDASNSSFSSTMIAEGPAVRMFERLQGSMVVDDEQVLWRVIDNGIAMGRLPAHVRDVVEIQIVPPSLCVRDRLDETKIDQIAFKAGIISPQTWSQHLGLDYDQEQKNSLMHKHDRAEALRKSASPIEESLSERGG